MYSQLTAKRYNFLETLTLVIITAFLFFLLGTCNGIEKAQTITVTETVTVTDTVVTECDCQYEKLISFSEGYCEASDDFLETQRLMDSYESEHYSPLLGESGKIIFVRDTVFVSQDTKPTAGEEPVQTSADLSSVEAKTVEAVVPLQTIEIEPIRALSVSIKTSPQEVELHYIKPLKLSKAAKKGIKNRVRRFKKTKGKRLRRRKARKFKEPAIRRFLNRVAPYRNC